MKSQIYIGTAKWLACGLALSTLIYGACGGKQGAGGDPEKGKEAMVRYNCGTCHTIPGIANANGAVGPALAGVAGRPTIAGGAIQNNPENLRQWVADPQKMKPGTAMPTLSIPEGEVRDIVAYLETLK